MFTFAGQLSNITSKTPSSMIAKVVGGILTTLGILYGIFIIFLYMNSSMKHDWYGRFYDLMDIGLIWPIIIDLFMITVGLILSYAVKETENEEKSLQH
jgi:uncharacterized BrkB/YihY/UPF0761 family membrane protein